MAGVPGKNVTVRIEDGVGIGTYTKLGKATVHRMVLNNSEVEVSHKDSGGWRDLFPEGSIKSMQVTMSLLLDDADAPQAELRSRAESTVKPAANFQIVDGAGDRYVGEFQISTFELGGETEGFGATDITLASNGPITREADV